MIDGNEKLKNRVLDHQQEINAANEKIREINDAEREAEGGWADEWRGRLEERTAELEALEDGAEIELPDGIPNPLQRQRSTAEAAVSELSPKVSDAPELAGEREEAEAAKLSAAEAMLEEIREVAPPFLEDLHRATDDRIEAAEQVMIGSDSLPDLCERAREAASAVGPARREVEWLRGRASFVRGAANGVEGGEVLAQRAQAVEDQLRAAVQAESDRLTPLAMAGDRVRSVVERGRRDNSGVQAIYQDGGPFDHLGPLPGSAIVHRQN